VKKIFLDANVLIDFIDPSRNKHKEAVEFIKTNVGNFFYTSCDILTTIYYIASKNRCNTILDKLEYILKLVKIINFSNELALKTIETMKKDKNFKDFEDTLQYELAKTIKADFIVTNDKNFYSPDIETITL